MTLVLLPNLLDESADIDTLPAILKKTINFLDGLICENEKNARKYLLKFISRDQMYKLDMKLLNEHTQIDQIKDLVKLISKKKYGLISDAGLPCIADPGSKLVSLANENNISVEVISGPSSIFIALMLSGFYSQKFYFHGYLPRKENDVKIKLKELEKKAIKEEAVQVFIEAPYRSDKIFHQIISSIKDDLYLCVAISITSKDQKVIVKKIKDFKKNKITIGKKPTVFLISKQ